MNRNQMDMLKIKISILVCFCLSLVSVYSQNFLDGFGTVSKVDSQFSMFRINPKKIILTSDSLVKNADFLQHSRHFQSTVEKVECCTITTSAYAAGLLLDFGKELNGSVEIITNNTKDNVPVNCRIRFGESVGEAMAELQGKGKATNDHAIRDYTSKLPWKGITEIGNTGFRFVYIELTDPNSFVELLAVRAILKIRNLEYKGTFSCSDTLLNQIWNTGAYTVQLNMQEYLWDGIKRDRLVWVGDLYVENLTINTVFGYNDLVSRSLDLARSQTPLPQWMHGLSTSSMWWVINQYEWFMYHADKMYLAEQHAYLRGLIQILLDKVDNDGKSTFEWGFIDWPSSPNMPAVLEATNALLLMTIEKGGLLLAMLNDPLAEQCQKVAARMKTRPPVVHNQKQEAALLAISGLAPAAKMSEIIKQDSTQNFSTFMGYFMLETLAQAGDYQKATDFIKQYWGLMIQLGATSFWEHFDVNWVSNAARIDCLPNNGQIDIHGTYGEYCYVGYRHSLCHGWASGPTIWLTRNVLGIKVTGPGCRKVTIQPHLGDLKWAKGSFPTPFGIITVEHRKVNGKTETKYTAPKEIEISLINN